MGKSQETFNKKEKEKKRIKKRQDKKKKLEERRANAKSSGFEDMLAYVLDTQEMANYVGNLTDTQIDPSKKKKVSLDYIEISVPKKEDSEKDAVRQGKVDFFNHSKGFGFIREQGTNEKYFVHVNGLIDEITENDKVSFELMKGLKGMNAVKVKKI